jgi:hypothetical protein
MILIGSCDFMLLPGSMHSWIDDSFCGHTMQCTVVWFTGVRRALRQDWVVDNNES